MHAGETYFSEIQQAMEAAGLPPMDPSTTQEVKRWLGHQDVLMAFQNGELDGARVTHEAIQAIRGSYGLPQPPRQASANPAMRQQLVTQLAQSAMPQEAPNALSP